MNVLENVNERSTAYLSVAFLDRYGNAALPTAVTWRIDCLSSQEEVRAWTAATPAAVAELVITAEDNAIRADENPQERRRVTVVATYGATPADQCSAEYVYSVRNLRGLT